MGIVTDYLAAQIERQVTAHHLVTWFDPGGHYAELARTLALPDTRVARYDGSFFALRREVDELLDGDLPPRLVLYVGWPPRSRPGWRRSGRRLGRCARRAPG